MVNEAKTSAVFRDLIRAKGYYTDPFIVVEEQKSDNAKINKLLINASKRGDKNGNPDFIIYSTEFPELLLVVEAKADINKHQSNSMDCYADYAVDGALLYASFLSKEFDVLAIGISGETVDTYRVSHYLQLKGEKIAHPVFSDKILSINDYYNGILQSNYKFNQDYAKLIEYTKTLNESLHAKKIKEAQRALLISGILIALKDGGFKAGYKKHSNVTQLVKSLYTAIDGQLSSAEIEQRKLDTLKSAFNFIKVNPALNDTITGKKFLEDLIDEIDREINGFMVTHKYVDTVSQFYVEFLRYANNDKGLGIVLTPPHITELFTGLAGVDKNSVVLDNCCGTGGFLISAMKKMLIDANGDEAKEINIRKEQLVGIEYDPDIYPLLISNMIIHRDGKTNIFFDDCFKKINSEQNINKEGIKNKFKPNIGFLNPPYKTKKSDIEEFEFILNNLEALSPNGTCIAIIPISCVIEKSLIAINMRERVLTKHTLEAVLSMPEELFHNSKVNTVTCAIILTAHKPHPKGKKTWFAYCRDDGFVKIKNKGRIDANHVWDDVRDKWVNAFRNKEIIEGFSLMKEVTAKDEWCVEAYMETNYDRFNIEDYENTVKKFLMFNFLDLSALIVEDGEDEDM